MIDFMNTNCLSGPAFSERVVKYWKKLPAYVITITSCQYFQEKVG